MGVSEYRDRPETGASAASARPGMDAELKRRAGLTASRRKRPPREFQGHAGCQAGGQVGSLGGAGVSPTAIPPRAAAANAKLWRGVKRPRPAWSARRVSASARQSWGSRRLRDSACVEVSEPSSSPYPGILEPRFERGPRPSGRIPDAEPDTVREVVRLPNRAVHDVRRSLNRYSSAPPVVSNANGIVSGWAGFPPMEGSSFLERNTPERYDGHTVAAILGALVYESSATRADSTNNPRHVWTPDYMIGGAAGQKSPVFRPESTAHGGRNVCFDDYPRGQKL